MAIRKFIPLMVIAVSAAVGLAGAAIRAKSPIFSPPVRTVTDVHSKCPEVKRSCQTCHPRAATSRWASHRLIPEMSTCAPCHEAARAATVLSPVTDGCRACHGTISPANMPTRSVYPRPNLRFSHAAHRATPCGRCHPTTGKGQDPKGNLDVVGMRQCFDCHANSACRTCHLTDRDGTLNTTINGTKLYPPRWLRGPSHGAEWAGSHAGDAANDSRYCAACHTERFCQDCHSGARRPRDIHPGEWLTTHGLNTRLDTPRCQGCHRKQSFCISCHRRAGVAPDSPPNARPATGSGQFHKGMKTPELMRRAKHDVTTCVSCHTESSCITCHARTNPHPRDFKRRCGALIRRNNRSCGKCHNNDVSRLCQ